MAVLKTDQRFKNLRKQGFKGTVCSMRKQEVADKERKAKQAEKVALEKQKAEAAAKAAAAKKN